ncbi:hypothetical protein HDU87_001207 [Geranomyces variabilis]|uniref:Uncharacterized protein n=1 Tax=Geranomyces variabilis TaxID=109894 RepID=A0AAD5TC23_9FUNG|nr:hypothetical protein HDU87_001207 [Geranomyces variabilis]
MRGPRATQQLGNSPVPSSSSQRPFLIRIPVSASTSPSLSPDDSPAAKGKPPGRAKARANLETDKKAYALWNETDEQLLIDWLTTGSNYSVWKCSGITDSSGNRRTHGDSKISIAGKILDHLVSRNGSPRSAKSIKAKIEQYESRYRKANGWLETTGEGCNSRDKKLGTTNILQILLDKFKWFEQLDPFFGKRASNTPAFTASVTTGLAVVQGNI